MEANKRIKDRRKQLGLTMLEVAKLVGVSEATISRWESGDIANMRRDKIKKLSVALKVSPDFIMRENDHEFAPYNPIVHEIPILGYISAGLPIYADEHIIGTTYTELNSGAEYFALKVKGDSMIPLYHEGDKVLVLKQSTMNYSGQIGVVIYGDDKGTLKRIEYAPGEDWMRLVPLNLNHPIVRIENEDLEHCRVIGIPRLLIREIKD